MFALYRSIGQMLIILVNYQVQYSTLLRLWKSMLLNLTVNITKLMLLWL